MQGGKLIVENENGDLMVEIPRNGEYRITKEVMEELELIRKKEKQK